MRHTRKRRRIRNKSLKSGGGKLSATAKEFVPPSASAIAANVAAVTNAIPSISLKNTLENAVAVDCEMVGVGRGESALAHVAIVNFNGKQLYNKYVIPQGGIESITNYRTAYSGITSDKLKNVEHNAHHSFETVKKEVHDILNGKIIVGHALINDFKVLEYRPFRDMVWDTAEMNAYKQEDPLRPGIRRPKKLKVLAKEIANNNIQRMNKTGHSPLEDARASMNIYRMSLGYPKIKYTNMSTA